jgi:hypothetical protein
VTTMKQLAKRFFVICAPFHLLISLGNRAHARRSYIEQRNCCQTRRIGGEKDRDRRILEQIFRAGIGDSERFEDEIDRG